MKKILIIEDDDLLRNLLTRFLSKHGYQTESAEDGEKGLLCLKETVFDLIITDIIMPGKEGIETIQEIRSILKDLPIIAISGGGRMSADSYLPLAEMLGANCTLAKPFRNEELLNKVRELLGEGGED